MKYRKKKTQNRLHMSYKGKEDEFYTIVRQLQLICPAPT